MKTSRFSLTILAAAAVMSAGCVKNDPRPVITITTQPTTPAALAEGLIPADTRLTVVASVTEGATLSYQWYENITAINEGGLAIDGATENTYTLPTDITENTYYYFCEISAEGATSVRTNAVTVSVSPIPRNARITWEDGKYALTTDPTDAGLCFKFGSVVGIFSANGANQVLPGTNTDTFDAGDIAWNPTGATDWASVPVYDDDTYIPDVDAAYHTVANVKTGKGDPCRLVGLDLAGINKTDANSLTLADVDNGQWRLPTLKENQAFTGVTSSGEYTGYWTTVNGVNGGMFPITAEGSEATFLPAPGSYRSNTDGSVMDRENSGLYWSNTVSGLQPRAYMISFDNSRIGADPAAPHSAGIFVRCVRQ